MRLCVKDVLLCLLYVNTPVRLHVHFVPLCLHVRLATSIRARAGCMYARTPSVRSTSACAWASLRSLRACSRSAQARAWFISVRARACVCMCVRLSVRAAGLCPYASGIRVCMRVLVHVCAGVF
jgi:hypothetical protein